MTILTVYERKITGLQFLEIENSIVRPQARVEKCAHYKDIFMGRTIFTTNTQKDKMDKAILDHL